VVAMAIIDKLLFAYLYNCFLHLVNILDFKEVNDAEW